MTDQKMKKQIRVITVPPSDREHAERMMSSITKEMKWSQATYTPRLLFEKYHDELPVFVKIAKGVYGNNAIDTVAQDEIVRVEEIAAQPRILMRDKKDNLLSLPADWPIHVRVLTKKEKKTKMKRISDVVEQFHLPVRVQFDKSTKWKFRIGSLVHSNKTFGEMDIVGYYTERYLKGNAILNGVLHKKVLLLPLYLNASLSVAQGIVQGTEEEWQELQDMYTSVATTIDFTMKNGTKDILMYNYDQYTLNNELSEFVRGLRNQDGATTGREKTDDSLGNMTAMSISESQIKQNGGVRTGETTATVKETGTKEDMSTTQTTTTTITSTGITASASGTQTQTSQEGKSDSGKASGSSSGSISSATKMHHHQEASTDFTEDEGTQTEGQNNLSVNVNLKAQASESHTVKSSDSGVYVSKGIQADDSQYPGRVLAPTVRSQYAEDVYLSHPDLGGVRGDPGASVVYVPVRDPEYDAFRSWRMRHDVYRRQARPMHGAYTSNDTVYVGDDDVFGDEYPTLQSRGRGRYGMVMTGRGGGGGGGYSTLQTRRTITQPPLNYPTSLSNTNMSRREMTSRVYTDFDDDYRRSRPREPLSSPNQRYDDVDAAPPLLHGNSTSKVWVDGNYNEPQHVNHNQGSLNHQSGQLRTTLYGSQTLGTTTHTTSLGNRSLGGSYRDLYDRGGLHIGLTESTMGGSQYGDYRTRQGVEQGGYEASNGVVLGVNRDSPTLSPSTPLQMQHGPKLRRRLSSSHKYRDGVEGGAGSALQSPLAGSPPPAPPTSSRQSRHDHHYTASADNIHQGVKRSSSFVNVTSGRISRGPSTITRTTSDAVNPAPTQAQHRSASVEVLHRGSSRSTSVKKERSRNKDRYDERGRGRERHSKKKTSSAQRDLMPQYNQPQYQQQQQPQQPQQPHILDSNPDIAYGSGERTSRDKRRMQSAAQPHTSASQPALATKQPVQSDLNISSSSGRYDVRKLQQGDSQANTSAMPASEMQEGSDTTSDSSSVVEQDVRSASQPASSTERQDFKTGSSSQSRSYSVQRYDVRNVQASVQSIPELSDTSSSSDLSQVVDETIKVIQVERKDGVDVKIPPIVVTGHTVTSKEAVSKLDSKVDSQAASKVADTQRQISMEKLQRRIEASKDASRGGINKQIIRNGHSHTTVREESSANRVTSLRQAYAVNKPSQSSMRISADLSAATLTIDAVNGGTSMNQSVTKTDGSDIQTTNQTIVTSGVKPASHHVTSTVKTTFTRSSSNDPIPPLSPPVSPLASLPAKQPSIQPASQKISSPAVQPASQPAIQPAKQLHVSVQPASQATSSTEKQEARKGVTGGTSSVTTSASERTGSRTVTTTKTTTHKVELRKKSETSMTYEHDVRESIRQLDDFLKTQGGDNVSMDSQGSAYIMGEQLTLGPEHLETWHF